MSDPMIELLYFLGTIICFALPAYALLYFDDDNAEM